MKNVLLTQLFQLWIQVKFRGCPELSDGHLGWKFPEAELIYEEDEVFIQILRDKKDFGIYSHSHYPGIRKTVWKD